MRFFSHRPRASAAALPPAGRGVCVLPTLSRRSGKLRFSELDSVLLSSTLCIQAISCHSHRKSTAFHLQSYVLFCSGDCEEVPHCFGGSPRKSRHLHLLSKTLTYDFDQAIQNRFLPFFLNCFCKGEGKRTSRVKPVFHENPDGGRAIVSGVSSVPLPGLRPHIKRVNAHVWRPSPPRAHTPSPTVRVCCDVLGVGSQCRGANLDALVHTGEPACKRQLQGNGTGGVWGPSALSLQMSCEPRTCPT